MAFTITAPDMKIIAAGTYERYANGADYMWALITYTKGDESSATFTFQSNKSGLNATYYELGSVNSSAAFVSSKLTLSATATVAVPVFVPAGADIFRVVITNTGGTPSGTIAISATNSRPVRS